MPPRVYRIRRPYPALEIMFICGCGMHTRSLHSILLLIAMLLAGMAASASSQTVSSQTNSESKARCKQLIEYFDRYGAARSEHSDGARNMTRIAASIDCGSGRSAEGVDVMEDLLAQKKFVVPPATGLAQAP